ncbi:MAG: basic amino acid ABC transporter substrate-binding protein, partial [Desulfovibrionales bacterium]|nr:basic amino acid ABC transporter substrate-binding protein [Desulfovibrionales bacterium]
MYKRLIFAVVVCCCFVGNALAKDVVVAVDATYP